MILLKLKICQLRSFFVAWCVAAKVACELLTVGLHLTAGITQNGFTQLCMKNKPRRHIAVRPELK
jgi:hypothetical protein